VTLTLTFGDLESHTIVYVSSTSIRITNDQISCFNFIVDGRTDGSKDIDTHIIRSSLRDDLKRRLHKM